MAVDNFGPPIKLATKQQLALEITARTDGCSLVVYQLPDGRWDCACCMPGDDIGCTDSPLELFRKLAVIFEGAENMPRPTDE